MSSGLSEIRQSQLEFWAEFAASAAAVSISAPKPAPKNWCYLPVGTGRAKIVLAVSFREGWVECKLALAPSKMDASGRRGAVVFDGLVEEREAIERELGFSDIVWGDPTPTRIYRRLSIAVKDRASWSDTFDWMISTAVTFKEVFGPRLSASSTLAPSHVEDVSPASVGVPSVSAARRPATGRQTGQGAPEARPDQTRSSAVAAGGAAPMIGTLFDALAKKCDLAVHEGSFPPKKKDLLGGASWLALYSREESPIYRYAFALWWGAATLSTTVAWVLLNPATGDTDGKPRPILTRCRHQSENWKSTGLIVVNLFAYRAGDPKVFKTLPEARAVGSHNDAVLRAITSVCGRTIAAWGDGGADWERSTTIRPYLNNPQCLPKNGKRVSLKGQPFYPKGIKLDAEPVDLPLATTPAP